MKSPNLQMLEQLKQLFERFITQHNQKYNCLPKVAFDNEWLSSCQQSEPDGDGFIEWKPVLVDNVSSFTNVENGLAIKLNTQFIDFFTHYYSESVPAEFNGEYLELLFAWNSDDIERLQQNIIAHVLMKKQLKQEITLFFAVTDNDDMILSVKNSTGEVWLEKVGSEPHEKLADSMIEFIGKLSIAL